MAKLIVLQGMSGTGKTTLARRLAQDLAVPCLPKDSIKEFLFDTLGLRGQEWTQTLGRAAARMLYDATEEVLLSGNNLIIENTFPNKYAQKEIQLVLQNSNAKALEIFCFTDDKTRLERVRNRLHSGRRHKGHAEQDEAYLQAEEAKQIPGNRLSELNVGTLIKFDTTFVTDQAYARLLEQIREFLAQA